MIKSKTDNRRAVEKVSRAALPEQIVKYIEEVLRGPEPKSQLISVLHKVQGHFG